MRIWRGLVGTAVVCTVVLLSTITWGAVVNVPSDVYKSIQEAIDDTTEGDTILVGPGIYSEQLYFGHHSVIVESTDGSEETVVDAQNSGPVVVFENNNRSTLKGFTLTRGVRDPDNPYFRGGGIVSTWSEPLVENCVIVDNEGDRGGGIYVIGGGTFRRCRIENNYAESRGGGIYTSPSNGAYGVFINTVIAKNTSGSGAGIYGSAYLLNCSVLNNMGGAGIMNTDIHGIITNTIIYGNEGPQLESSFSTVTYSNIEGDEVYLGEGNIAEDPLFQDDEENYYRLAENSPCIDRGTAIVEVENDIDGENRPEGQGMDMGADEYVPVSHAAPNVPPLAVLNGPDTVLTGESISFDACESTDPDGESGLLFEWEWGNEDSTDENAETESCTETHSWDKPGKVTVSVTVIDEEGATAVASIELEVKPSTSSATLYAALGDSRHRWYKDYDLFLFDGEKGEEVTIRLAVDQTGYHKGKKATLVLKDGIRKLRFRRKNGGALPNAITAVLPKSGKYRIWVIEQPSWRWWKGWKKRCWKGWKKRNGFRGDYCLTLESSKSASSTLRETRWVE